MNTKQTRLKTNTRKLIEDTQKNFLIVNPEYENVTISKDKIVYEVFKNYNEILKELIKNGEVKIYVKK